MEEHFDESVHAHEHEHDHEHSHDHAHHEHNHEHIGDAEKLSKMLCYLKDHNEHHAHEMLHLSEDAAALGNAEVSELLKKASLIYDEGNVLLAEALKKL